ncbi:hypothetical protein GGX14DRAFT_406004 [Mycena pura]|uniref:Uncharacterized protein n=1 Tax=Mycena pura TaxID=153505 RepID=A0AAD6URB5_9AGAR|nr:hypothetical protein GGX14DRAFT_406004 [Mycena pura]
MPLKIGPGKVGQQFNDTLATIRAKARRTLDAQAIDWLRAARYKVMRQLEASYHQLEQTRDTPASQPAYVDPAKSLVLRTDPLPNPLSPYSSAFQSNLRVLMKDCGFQHCSVGTMAAQPEWGICIIIRFPAQLPPLPQILHVEDEFSRRATAQEGDKAVVGASNATNFGRLIDVRAENSSAPQGHASSSRKRPRVASPDAGGGRRLRSATRANSSATRSGNMRRREE